MLHDDIYLPEDATSRKEFTHPLPAYSFLFFYMKIILGPQFQSFIMAKKVHLLAVTSIDFFYSNFLFGELINPFVPNATFHFSEVFRG